MPPDADIASLTQNTTAIPVRKDEARLLKNRVLEWLGKAIEVHDAPSFCPVNFLPENGRYLPCVTCIAIDNSSLKQMIPVSFDLGTSARPFIFHS